MWLAGSEEVDGVTGRFFERRAEMPCPFRDTDREETLVQACGRLVRQLERQG